MVFSAYLLSELGNTENDIENSYYTHNKYKKHFNNYMLLGNIYFVKHY